MLLLEALRLVKSMIFRRGGPEHIDITFPLIKSVQRAYSTHVQYEREKAKQAKEAERGRL